MSERVKGLTAEETRERLDRFTAGLELPEGIAVGESAGRRSFDEDLAALRFASVLSVLFIYLLMGFLFESFILPLSILLTIPLASIGVACFPGDADEAEVLKAIETILAPTFSDD